MRGAELAKHYGSMSHLYKGSQCNGFPHFAVEVFDHER